MTLRGQLDYRSPKPNAIRRAVVKVAGTRYGAWCLARVLPQVDRQLLALSGGRISLAELVAGTPLIALTTRGARTGALRTHHLVGIPVTDTIAVIGTNFARSATPAWVHNLLADPTALVTYRRARIGVTAREVAGAEYEQVFAAASLIYPVFGVYRARLSHRPPKVFILEPQRATPS
jgi:deazaflavin-dependent oxidoreductase (nitroreductase family)